jgi:hypothetical protein
MRLQLDGFEALLKFGFLSARTSEIDCHVGVCTQLLQLQRSELARDMNGAYC